MATDGPIGLKLKRALLWPRVDPATKFGQDRIIRLGSRAVRNRHTDGQAGWLTGVTGQIRLPERILKRYRKMLKTLMKRNFLPYTTVPESQSCVEYFKSPSDLKLAAMGEKLEF